MKQAFTLVEIMIVVTIIAALVLIALPHLLRARINANEAAAQTTLKTISGALESYAAANSGDYPTAISNLTGSTPKYLNEDYTNGPRQGYNFNCSAQLNTRGYNCSATPVTCNITGTNIFRVLSGGILLNVGCSQE